MKNYGLVLQEFNCAPKFLEYDEPVYSHSVVIQIEQTGICGTDFQFMRGAFKLHRLPAVFGHELVGRVVSLGDVQSDMCSQALNVGDRVVVASSFHENCHQCRVCTVEDAPWACPHRTPSDLRIGSVRLGKFAGGFSNYLVLSGPERQRLLRVDVPLERAVLFEPLSIAVEAFSRAQNLFERDVVVLGSGTVGLLLTALLRMAGARSVTVVGAKGQAEALAYDMGASAYFPFSGKIEDYPTSEECSTDGLGAHYVFEFTGDARAVAAGLSLLRHHGELLTGGIVGRGQSLAIDPFQDLWERDLALRSIRGRQSSSFVSSAALLSKLPRATDRLVTQVIPVAEAPLYFQKSLEDFGGGPGNGIKTVITQEL